MKIGKNYALAVVIAALGAGSGHAATIGGGTAELFNAFEPLPPASMTGGATSFTIVFAGNVMSAIDTSATQSDPGLNPFAYLNQIVGSGTTSVTAALDTNGNTDVTFTGSNAIMSTSSFDFGNGLPHVGLASSGSGGTLDLISQTWSNNSSSYTLPGGLSVSIFSGGGGLDPFAIFYAQVTTAGLTSGEWFELPYTAGTTPPTLTITNYTGSAETLSDVGYFLSPTQIPLDDLNFGLTPPTGDPGSPFIPLPSLDGISLPGGDGLGGAGGSIVTPGLVPEPSSIISLGVGLLLVAAFCGRLRILVS